MLDGVHLEVRIPYRIVGPGTPPREVLPIYILVEIGAPKDDRGNMLEVEQKVLRRFLELRGASVRLEAGRRYRVVGIYDNPLPRTVVAGATAHIVGVFEPDDGSAWSGIDGKSPEYLKDMGGLPAPLRPFAPTSNEGHP